MAVAMSQVHQMGQAAADAPPNDSDKGGKEPGDHRGGNDDPNHRETVQSTQLLGRCPIGLCWCDLECEVYQGPHRGDCRKQCTNEACGPKSMQTGGNCPNKQSMLGKHYNPTIQQQLQYVFDLNQAQIAQGQGPYKVQQATMAVTRIAMAQWQTVLDNLEYGGIRKPYFQISVIRRAKGELNVACRTGGNGVYGARSTAAFYHYERQSRMVSRIRLS